MHAELYPHGAPRIAESVALLGVGVLSVAATYFFVHIGQKRYDENYNFKRLS